ncbi:MAG: zinc ribbon domain-containing protein [Verrucomicrobiae bacterium]|nr:zinc ribbon domain-containing protein [Verrucomicrobiae bacterium]
MYAYRCTQCGHKFEKIQNFSADPETECPKCLGLLERPLTAPRLHFKGAGWYVNDYAARSSESDTGSEPPSSESKAHTKAPAAKTDSSTPAPAAAPATAPSTSTASPSAPGSSTPGSST